jgi:NAD(P)-dependent dehydrogenase (short-subunit alcohol dehydrogenase family)
VHHHTFDLTGRVAVVTGGATGIGRAVAAQLAIRGASVVIAGRNQPRGEAVAEALARTGCDVRFSRADVRHEAEVDTLMSRTASIYGGIDYLFNNAGVEGVKGPIASQTEETVDELLAINLKGAFLCMKHAAPRMAERGGGVVVNTASFVGTIVPFPTAVLYGATKAAVLSMTQSVAAAFVDDQVRVYAVCPWITDTPMMDRLTGFKTDAKLRFGMMNPSGVLATPEDVAHVVVSLFTDAKGLDSGDAVLVDSGGITQKVRPLSAWEPVGVS